MADKKIVIDAFREAYSTEDVRETMTVGELIRFLSDYDEDTPVYLGHDMKTYGWYTYGGISEGGIYDQERLEDEFGEEDE